MNYAAHDNTYWSDNIEYIAKNNDDYNIDISNISNSSNDNSWKNDIDYNREVNNTYLENLSSNIINYDINVTPKNSINDSDIQDNNIIYKKKEYNTYHILEFINSFCFSLIITHIHILIYILNLNLYIPKILIHSLALYIITHISSDENTIRSINLTTEFTLINSIIFNYDIVNLIRYLLYQFVGYVLANIISISLFWNILNNIDITKIISILVTFNTNDTNYIIFVFNSIISNLLLAILITQSINRNTSIEYIKINNYRIIIYSIINLIFSYNNNSILSISYNLSIRLCISIFKNDITGLIHNNYIIVLQIIIPLLVISIFTYISNTYLNKYYKHIHCK